MRLPAGRTCLFLFSIVFSGVAIDAHAEYVGTVLYPIGLPNGFTNYTLSIHAERGEVVGWGAGPATGITGHALRWAPNAPNGIDLKPTWATGSSFANGNNGSQQVGEVLGVFDNPFSHAVLWNGTASSAVDLHPVGYARSRATGTNGFEQVGQAFPDQPNANWRAMRWTGNAASGVDLHSAAYTSTSAEATDGLQQVGNGFVPELVNIQHALLWTGTSQSCVDLHPSGYTRSQALGVAGGEQVGTAYKPNIRAMLWHGTAGSAIDLHPDGWDTSKAYATNGTHQVGQVFGGTGHAALWSGTRQSFVDLHALLVGNFATSRALEIAADGTIYGIARGLDSRDYVVAWTVPEPNVSVMLGSVMLVAGSFRLRRRLL